VATHKPVRLSETLERFLAEDHVAALITLRPEGSPHAVPVRFTWDASSALVRVMTVASRRKATNVAAGSQSRAAVCQVVGYRWLTLEGRAAVSSDPAHVAEAARRYQQRYSTPPPDRPELVVIEITVDRVLTLSS
jgi:F420H(2)-dependent biliverdin reductase